MCNYGDSGPDESRMHRSEGADLPPEFSEYRVCDTHCRIRLSGLHLFRSSDSRMTLCDVGFKRHEKRWSLILWVDMGKRFARYYFTAWQ
jgi:hypothetical protein